MLRIDPRADSPISVFAAGGAVRPGRKISPARDEIGAFRSASGNRRGRTGFAPDSRNALK